LIEPTETRQFPSKRRRTPGLRREEVAQMAGISPSWYARLEQAEETATPSPTALDSIAKVLRLVPVERAYLFHLAGRVDPIHASGLNDKLVVSTVESFVLSISSPAYLLDKYWTPLLWNAEAAKVFSLWLQGPELNLLRHNFLNPEARTFVVDWERRSHQLVAQFRFDYGNNVDDANMLELVGELQDKSDVFRSIWADQKVLFRDGNEKTYDHPQLGLLNYFQTTFLLAAEPTLKLVVATPRN
jgi:transcriptional regulator with XRE-family HTH domain